MNNKLSTINKWLIIILIILQPIFDIIKTNIVHDVQVFGLSLFEILNIMLVAFSLILSFYLNRNNKHFKICLLIIPIFILYCVFHYINMLHFNLSIYENANFNFFVESYYLFRMFMVPLLLLINLYYSDIKKESCLKVIEILAFIISFTIVISNIFKFGYSSYSTVNYEHKSIFDWFFFNSSTYNDYYNITSKGLFSSANQISAILFMICPIIMYQAYKKRSVFNYILLFIVSLAMLMLGTKVANIGIILIFVLFILIYFILRILKKIQLKNSKCSIKPIFLMFVIILVLFCFSPISHKLMYTFKNGSENSGVQNAEKYIDDDTEYDDIEPNENSNHDMIDRYKLFNEIKSYDCKELSSKQANNIVYFYNNYKSFLGVHSFITKNYNVDKHTSFWCNYIKEYKDSNYRYLKNSIYKNIQIENNNNFDKLFGLGYTLNFIYTEQDYTYQYFSYGIIGFITFIGPYFAVIAYLGYTILKNYKEKFNLENIIYLIAPCLGITVAYFSGHVFEKKMSLIILATIIGFNLINNKNETQRKKKVLFISSTGGHLSELLQLKPLFKEYDYNIITEKTASTIKMKNEYKNRINYLVFGSKDHIFSYIFKFGYNCIKSLILYIKIRPEYIVSTGTHTAVPISYIGKLFGTKIIYIETFANSKTKTMAGRLVYPIANIFIVQWEPMLKLYPKAIYGGWIY